MRAAHQRRAIVLALAHVSLQAEALHASAGRGSQSQDEWSSGPVPDVLPALACLRLTTPSLELAYPSDAEEHFEEVQRALEPWFGYAQTKFMKDMKNPYHCGEGYCGPWIENHWITRFLGNRTDKDVARGRLSDTFGPYIPIFMQFVDTWSADVFKYEDMISALKKVVRPGVPYITVVQHDTGLACREAAWGIHKELPNLLVLSAGGYGHVPVPLVKQLEKIKDPDRKPVEDRPYLLSFMGTASNAPYEMREKMIDAVKQTANMLGISKKVHIGWGDDWKKVMRNSKVSLAPRGYGRTSFHVVEALQMGLVPVHVYLDTPWVPYAGMFSQVGFVTDVPGLPAFIERLSNTSDVEFTRMEERVRRWRESHFTMEGVMDQISLFMTGRDGGGDLRCQALPKNING